MAKPRQQPERQIANRSLEVGEAFDNIQILKLRAKWYRPRD